VSLELAAGGTCAGRPCWKPLGGTSPSGFSFSDATGAQQGMQKLKVKGGKLGRDKLLAKAGGAALVLPAPSGSQLFAQDDDVTVQLVTDAGSCWESVFPPSAAVVNRSDLYKAKR
jgi:hypothetical protein